jgi:hypothetical protein
MNLPPRQKLYLALATLVFVSHLSVAAFTHKGSFALTMYGDAIPCALLVLAILAACENFRHSPGVLPIFWKLFAAGLAVFLGSQTYWFCYDWRQLNSVSSPITGDTLFLLAHVCFLSALALRPHSATARSNLRIRFLDLGLLSLWWFALYGYFSLSWQFGRQDLSGYSPSYYLLAFVQHSVIIVTLAVLCVRKSGVWRRFYALLLFAFVAVANGNLLLNTAIELDQYYAGSFYDTTFLFGIYLFVPVAVFGGVLEPIADARPNCEIIQGVWTARLAMLAILSLPIMALFGMFEKNIPTDVASFRLRLVFGAMLLLGGLVYRKFNLLAREINHSVQLTRDSIENLDAVQRRVTQSEKLVALGRLAAGAAHEISNPLTAIFGYSELLTDIPALTPNDRDNAQRIQEQVRQAQAAVSSLRDTLRRNSSSVAVDKTLHI